MLIIKIYSIFSHEEKVTELVRLIEEIEQSTHCCTCSYEKSTNFKPGDFCTRVVLSEQPPDYIEKIIHQLFPKEKIAIEVVQ